MTAINEIIQKGNAYRTCIDDSDAANLKWARQSFWTAASDVEFEDGMTAEQKLNELSTNLNQLFQSASDGKSLIASTLTGLGVNTSSDATYQTMSDNIKILATNIYNAGRTQGQADVVNDPVSFGVSTGTPDGTILNVTLEMYENGMVNGASRGTLRFKLSNGKLVQFEETGMTHTFGDNSIRVDCRPYDMC